MSSVVGLVLNYRDPARTTACLQSMIDAGVTKAVVVDNSGQEAGRVTVEHLTTLSSARIQVVLCESNLGFAAGANLGVAKCSELWPGHWVLLVNNDALLSVGLPDRLAAALLTNAAAATAFPAMIQDGIRFGWTWYQPWFGLVSADPLPGSFRFASGCCQLIAPERVGTKPFDETFFMYGEDIALAWRLQQAHLCQVFVTDAVVIHEGSASSHRGSIFYETLLVECHLNLARKLSKGRLLRYAAMLALRCMLLPFRALFRACRTRSLTPLVGLVRGARRAAQSTQPGEAGVPVAP